MELLTADNLTFLLPLVVAVLLVLSMCIGLPMGDHAVHVDLHTGPHVDAPAHADAFGGGILHGFLSFFGIGKVPFAIVIVSVCLVWGITGLALGLVALKWSLVAKMATSAVAAVLGTNLLASGLARALPSIESYAVATEALVTEHAEVIHEVTPAGGVARLVDSEGNLRDLACCVLPGAATLARGTRVMLQSYDAVTERFIVERLPDLPITGSARTSLASTEQPG